MTYPRRPVATASMLHELRMIAQSFFRHRTNASIFGQQPESSSLFCAPCYKGGVKTKAVAIDDGKSVCKNHLI